MHLPARGIARPSALDADYPRRPLAVRAIRIQVTAAPGAVHGITQSRRVQELVRYDMCRNPRPSKAWTGHPVSACYNISAEDSMNTKMSRPLYEADPDIAAAIDNETRRQHEGLELIASENFVSEAVLEAMGSVFTNKYAEGYPGKRYYGGCEYADIVENLARDRAKQLFGAEHANVQPHAGSQANMAAMYAVLQPCDTILGLNLAHGGHLTHGHHLNFSGKTYRFVAYGVKKEDERIDYDEIERLA